MEDQMPGGFPQPTMDFMHDPENSGLTDAAAWRYDPHKVTLLSLNSISSDKVVATNGRMLFVREIEKQYRKSPPLDPGELIRVVQVEMDVFCVGTDCGRLLWQFDDELAWQTYNPDDSRPIHWIRLALPYVTLGIGQDVHALSLSRSLQDTRWLGTWVLPENMTLAAARYLSGTELRGSRVDAVINEEGVLQCWYGIGSQMNACCEVTDCTAIFEITSNGTMLVNHKSGVPMMVQAISRQSVPVPELCDPDISDTAVVEANDALILVTLHPHSLSVWSYIDSNWHPDVISLESTPKVTSARTRVQAVASGSRMFIYWLQEGAMGIVSATINENASRPPELLPHDPIVSAGSSINEIIVPIRTLLEQGGTLFPLYGDRVQDPAIRERNIRLLGQGLLPYEGWLPTHRPEIKPLQLLIPRVDNVHTIESFIKRMQNVPRCEAICVIRQYVTLDAHTNLEKWAEKVRLLETYDYSPVAGQGRSKSRWLKFRYDPISRMQRHGYGGALPDCDLSILSFAEDPEAILERLLRPPVNHSTAQRHCGSSDGDLQKRLDQTGKKSVKRHAHLSSDESEVSKPVEDIRGQGRRNADIGDRIRSKANAQEGDVGDVDDTRAEPNNMKEESDDENGEDDVTRMQRRAREQTAMSPGRQKREPTGADKSEARQRGAIVNLKKQSDIESQEGSVTKAKICTVAKASSVGPAKSKTQRGNTCHDKKEPPEQPFATPVRTFLARAQPVRHTSSRRRQISDKIRKAEQ